MLMNTVLWYNLLYYDVYYDVDCYITLYYIYFRVTRHQDDPHRLRDHTYITHLIMHLLTSIITTSHDTHLTFHTTQLIEILLFCVYGIYLNFLWLFSD